MASSTEATGIDAEAVVASLVAERREHAALAALTQATESATIDAPANGETPTESPGGNANSNQEQEEAATATPAEPVGEAPTAAKGTVILPVLGETPLPEPEILDLPAPEVSAPPLPALPDVPLP